MVNVYILKLIKNKFYVGKTNDLIARVNRHIIGESTLWTKLYKPISVLENYPDCDEYDEDKYTIKTMAEHGIDNVRGGTFSSVKLSKANKYFIDKMIRSAKDECYKCGVKGHFAKECTSNKTKSIEREYYYNEKLYDDYDKYNCEKILNTEQDASYNNFSFDDFLDILEKKKIKFSLKYQDDTLSIDDPDVFSQFHIKISNKEESVFILQDGHLKIDGFDELKSYINNNTLLYETFDESKYGSGKISLKYMDNNIYLNFNDKYVCYQDKKIFNNNIVVNIEIVDLGLATDLELLNIKKYCLIK